MGCRQCYCLLRSVVQQKRKHCRKPYCCNGVVDTFGPSCLIWYFFWGQVELTKLVHIPILSFHYFVKKLWNSICWTCTPVPFSPTPSPRITQHSFHLFGFWPMYVPVQCWNFALVESKECNFFPKKCVMFGIVVLFVSSFKGKVILECTIWACGILVCYIKVHFITPFEWFSTTMQCSPDSRAWN